MTEPWPPVNSRSYSNTLAEILAVVLPLLLGALLLEDLRIKAWLAFGFLAVACVVVVCSNYWSGRARCRHLQFQSEFITEMLHAYALSCSHFREMSKIASAALIVKQSVECGDNVDLQPLVQTVDAYRAYLETMSAPPEA